MPCSLFTSDAELLGFGFAISAEVIVSLGSVFTSDAEITGLGFAVSAEVTV
jgi:hypothetical protein